VTPGIKERELETKLNGLAQQEQQNVARAESLRPPGHLREVTEHLIEALQLRVSGCGARGRVQVDGEAEGLRPRGNRARRAGEAAARERRRVGRPLPDTRDADLDQQGIHGVAVPQSHIVGNIDIVSARRSPRSSSGSRAPRPGGTASGLHGTASSPSPLSRRASCSRASRQQGRRVDEPRVRGRGEEHRDNLESKIPVTLTIQKQGSADQADADDRGDQPRRDREGHLQEDRRDGVFGSRVTLKVDVTPVENEARIENNTYQYPLFSA
jgi:hypothetical protein